MTGEDDTRDGTLEVAPELALRALTPARVALGRTGTSLATRHSLEFLLAHAQARDAVYSSLGTHELVTALHDRKLEPILVRSAARDRTEYLQRPDLGRKLAEACASKLAGYEREPRSEATVVSLILADGLSALAVERHGLAVLDALLPLLGIAGAADHRSPGWSATPVVVAEQARVALGDEIGAALHADLAIVLIGERPGLSSPSSLGAYITWGPRPGRTDAERNCVSNIRLEGLDYASAAAKIAWFAAEARRIGSTGITLRDGTSDAAGRAVFLK